SNTEYIYQFASFDKQKNVSPFSETISAKTHSISAVSYVEAISNYPRKVKIIWNPHQDTRVSGYIVERRDKNGNWQEISKIQNRLLVEYLDTKLDDGTTYEYQIYAYNANGSRSLPSKSVQATTKPKPVQITNFKATNNIPKQINLSWNLHKNPEVTSYKILRSSFISSFYTTLATLPSNTDSYQDLIGKDGEQYSYKIVATDKDGIDSLETGPISGSTLAVPNAPNITYARIENGSVVLKWNPTDNRATEYIVYKKDSLFFGETLRYNKVLTTEFIDKEVKAGEKYYYRVSAIDKNGLESKTSQEVVLSLPK
ncbi:MAG: fibronectin type III domain-containing protein, partial [Helicobacter sp.]|nr:fibronectin type III domain-containing protein [Helicobacter sp.]